MAGPRIEQYDDVVVGGGHNGLVAAAYLAGAGRSVLVLERADDVGGAAISTRAFKGVDARLSRYSYLVSLLPDRIVRDLGLEIELRSRPVASYTPYGDGGLLVEREEGPATAESFRRLTGSDREYAAWQRFYSEVGRLAERLAPTLLEPLRSADEVRGLVGARAWDRFLARPLGEVVESEFDDDLVRGVVLTDGLIGTFTSAYDPTLRQNICFLYHIVGNGTGEWRVPVGGMGAVTAALGGAARTAGARITTGAEVVGIDADGRRAQVTYLLDGATRQVAATNVLANVAPATLDVLLGTQRTDVPEGSQMKVNLLLERLPRLRSGLDPKVAFAGTFHVGEAFSELQKAYDQAASGEFPSDAPAELYCHTLTDPSILGADLAARGWQTLTLFGLHTPASLFAGGAEALRTRAVQAYLAALNTHLAEPIEDCLANDADGEPCIEAKTPLDLEAALGMPGGHIFHGDLSWPWAVTPERIGQWGVETGIPNVLICGAGSTRGGGVSGIGGHNAASAVLSAGAR